ncbi:MAG: hypothetical protein MHPSP_002013 [Paramarteilia canceri]
MRIKRGKSSADVNAKKLVGDTNRNLSGSGSVHCIVRLPHGHDYSCIMKAKRKKKLIKPSPTREKPWQKMVVLLLIAHPTVSNSADMTFYKTCKNTVSKINSKYGTKYRMFITRNG